MTTNLIQKHLIKGTREFEIIDDHVDIRIKMPMRKEETLTVMLTVLNPEPVIGSSSLDFNSRVNGEPLLSLFIGKPNLQEFNAFVATLKQRATDEFNAFAGIRASATGSSEGLPGNLDEAPPEFEDASHLEVSSLMGHVNVERIDEALRMLETHLDAKNIEPVLTALAELKANPESELHMQQLIRSFNELGPMQGAVLTYAPYINLLMSDDPFGNRY